MIKIDYPKPGFRIKYEEGKEYIFDQLRKRWLLLTPEEWVRQNFIQYLVQVKEYPATLIAQEKEIQLGELVKRFDILVYDHQHQPWLMVECKEAKVKMDERVLQQILRYNLSTPVQYIVITNGNDTFCWEKREGMIQMIQAIPSIKNGR